MEIEKRYEIEGRVIRLPPRKEIAELIHRAQSRTVWLGKGDFGWIVEFTNEANQKELLHLEEDLLEAFVRLWNVREVTND
jgi:hypothetical protein